MNKPKTIDLNLLFSNQNKTQQVGKIRIIDNSKVEVVDAAEDWQERIDQMANTINQAEEIPVIGGTKMNRLGTFTMMHTVKKGEDDFPDAIIGYLKINGFEAKR
ncbi:MAG: hypothetical protein AB7U85_03140 [Alphaproteobacteria bacterium]